MNNSPWKEMYDGMYRECPKSNTESHVLEMLGAGKDMSTCLEYWMQMGMDEESFLDFMNRADRWETEELRRINEKSDRKGLNHIPPKAEDRIC